MATTTSYKDRIAQAMAVSALAARLDAIKVEGDFSVDTIDQFGEFIDQATDEELFRMSPVRYAKSKNISKSVATDLFLHATHAGILEFSWGLLCKACGAFMTTPGALRSIEKTKHCSFCAQDIAINVDSSVEVAFTISPTIRKLKYHDMGEEVFDWNHVMTYFSSSVVLPDQFKQAIQNSIVDVKLLEPGGKVTFTVDVKPGNCVIAAPAMHAYGRLDVKADSQVNSIVLELLEGEFVPKKSEVAAGKLSITVRNRTSKKIHFVFLVDAREPFMEQGTQPEIKFEPFLTGKELVTNQTFRDLFKSESLPADGGLEFKSITLLFTDLKGSTAMYKRLGDFKAYELVGEHFDLLKKIVRRSGGAVVKTIGDAIMASFAEPAQALQAAVEMQKEIGQIGNGKDLVLKIGVHTGSCIAVELNERLDYFGQTVNIAARVQGTAEPGQIALTDNIYSAPRIRDVVSASKMQIKQASVSLKGVSDNYQVYYLD